MRPRPNDTGWRLFARTACARAYPRILWAVRERLWMFFEILLPLIGVSAYAFVYRAIHAPEEFVGFVILGAAMSAYWLNVLWAMAAQLFWEREVGNLEQYIMAPTSLMAVLLGMACGGMFNSTLRAFVILSIGSWLFGVHYSVESVPLVVITFVLSLVALYGMGMMFASVFLMYGREGWHLVNLMQEPVFLLSGTYFPIRGFNVWIAAAASLIPLTLSLDALRQLVFRPGAARGFLSVATELWLLALLAVVFLAAARLLLSYIERLAAREGRLTENRT
jgi:ABC-2 type transport system permease protein